MGQISLISQSVRLEVDEDLAGAVPLEGETGHRVSEEHYTEHL